MGDKHKKLKLVRLQKTKIDVQDKSAALEVFYAIRKIKNDELREKMIDACRQVIAGSP